MSTGSNEKGRADVAAQLEILRPHLEPSKDDPRPIAVMMCGCSGSGKSTMSKAITTKHPGFHRISIDAIYAEHYGLVNVDYDDEHMSHRVEQVYEQQVRKLLESKQNVVLDRAFYAKEDRDYWRRILEDEYSAKVVLIYLDVPFETLWDRVQSRRLAGINADCARAIDEDMLRGFYDGFEVPKKEDEIVLAGPFTSPTCED